MRILNTVHIRGVGPLGVVCLLTFLLRPRLSLGQVEQDETVVPPGKDVGGDRGVGMPPTSKLTQAVDVLLSSADSSGMSGSISTNFGEPQ
jgi:hypothetical protein